MEPGTRLGPYEILEPLGAGGMGEVYLAQDTRLGRKVAIKVLPQEYAGDPERLVRFEQEARAAAALNHPHIAVLHDVGSDGGVHFMVQELLEGKSLQELLDAGPLPLKRALALGAEVAEALAAAHQAGIVHRDLKPGNLFVSAGGHAKVLDFGLAKLIEWSTPSGPGDNTMSPTVVGTTAGMVLGTAGYMAPEQVAGEQVDGRADLFAFGCVLYEMVTGSRAFAGRSLHETLSKIAHEEPPDISVPGLPVPQELERILRKCLAKDADGRYQGSADLAVDLRALGADLEAGRAAVDAGGSAAVKPVPASVPVWWLAVAVAVSLAAVVWSFVGGSAPPAPRRVEFDVTLEADHVLPAVSGRLVALSPDGELLVYEARGPDGVRRFFQRRVGSVTTTAIPGPEGGKSPEFSPDGHWLVFHDDVRDLLVKVPLDGGQPLSLAEVRGTVVFSSWGDDGNIVYELADDGVWRVPAAGGDAELLLAPSPEIVEYDQPFVLPGSRAVLLQEDGRGGEAAIVALNLETGEIVRVLEDSGSPRYLDPGYLLYTRQGSVFAVRFDADRLEVLGDPVLVLQGLRVDINRRAQFAVSAAGHLAYLPGEGTDIGDSLAWVDRDRLAEPVPGSQIRGVFHSIRLSPDGDRVAAEVQGDDASSVVVLDLASQVLTRLDPRSCVTPAWSADGQTIYATCLEEDGAVLVSRPADFSSPSRTLSEPGRMPWVGSATPDGSSLLVFFPGDSQGNLTRVAVDGSGETSAVRESRVADHQPMISPDGRWLAYTAREAGDSQVFVTAFPGPGATIQGSSDAASGSPLWSADGQRLHWLVPPGTVMSSEFQSRDGVPSTSVPTVLFEGVVPYTAAGMQYSVSGDRQRILVSPRQVGTRVGSANRRIRVVLNWARQLESQLAAEQ